MPAGDYDEAIHIDQVNAPSILARYIEPKPHASGSQD
jgi:hypothetical protein